MSSEVVSYMLASKNVIKRLQFQIILQCAPLLKGMKRANIANIDGNCIRKLEHVLDGTGLSYRVLAIRKERYLVMFYRREELKDYLSQQEVRKFLGIYGYQELSLELGLSRLSSRICMHSQKETEFPHEIGVFLDYPLEDVEGFIQHSGKNSLLTGYWKVYHNPEKAQMTFLSYDRAKDSAVNEFLTGKSIREIAKKSA